MSQLRYRISFDAQDHALLNASITAALFPLMGQAVRAVAQQTAANWQEAVQRAKLWSGEKDAYAQSINWKMTGDLSAMVEADYSKAGEIETGRPARDLKRMLDTSMKTRVSAKGRRYLIIPFRHSTPGQTAHGPAMPAAVYQQAKKLEPSKIIGQTTRVSGTGAWDMKTKAPATVPQNKYSWGGKLVAKALGGDAGMKKYVGMYRFSTTTPGGKRSSSFMTFRVMAEGSPGWIIAPQPGQFIAQKVAQDMQPLAVQAFSEAVNRSLR